ncbi:hypothetical protein OEZ85_011245 [Tetradesmus obliquus]|uniref:Major facilitator superfamily (MFS) profile domain-containing protein n=1 Tax=Tetradesmus obliquus TaxID=3088 RepID=A0ABY8TTL8_TETOB|nr:hypothetical protein OEZ85_011245 [Tetradesmus obliquus]
MGQIAGTGASHGQNEGPEGCIVALDTCPQSSEKTADDKEDKLKPILRKVSRVLLPLLFLASMLNYLDRGAISFAALQMNGQLGLSLQDYGLGSGLFFLGYGVAMVPSTYLTMLFGAKWYAAITVAWGVVAACCAFVTSRAGFFATRLLLGLAEAGAWPSASHLLCQFYPSDRLTRPYAVVCVSSVIAAVFAAPLAAGLMSLDQRGGLAGWQWLFLVEGVPSVLLCGLGSASQTGLQPVLANLTVPFTAARCALQWLFLWLFLVEGVPSVLLGMCCWVWLPSSPLTAAMLSREEGQLLHEKVHGSAEAAAAACQRLRWRHMLGLMLDALRRPLLWLLLVVGFLWVLAAFALNSWLPLIIKNMLAGTALTNSSSSGGSSSSSHTQEATLLTAIPYVCATAANLAVAWHADRVNERSLHTGVPFVLGGIVLGCFTVLTRLSFAAGFAGLTVAMTCAYAGQSTLLASVAASLDPKHAGVGLALFNAACAAVGGFAANAIAGGLAQRMGSFSLATIVMGVFMAAAGLLAAGLGIYQQCWKQPGKDEEAGNLEVELQQQQAELRYRLGSRCTSSSLMQIQ